MSFPVCVVILTRFFFYTFLESRAVLAFVPNTLVDQVADVGSRRHQRL